MVLLHPVPCDSGHEEVLPVPNEDGYLWEYIIISVCNLQNSIVYRKTEQRLLVLIGENLQNFFHTLPI